VVGGKDQDIKDVEEVYMAKIRRVDHIAVAVRDLDDAIERFSRILGAELIQKKEMRLSGSRICVAYLKLGDTIIGLDQATEPDGFVAKFIERRGEGLHHLGLEVDDLDAFKGELAQKGVRIPHEEAPGGVRREFLLSPKDLCGVVCQVIEWKHGQAETMEDRINRLNRSLDEWG
jgi:methylmalonyl-CoA/ethylmalonyl-CoA epimerase